MLRTVLQELACTVILRLQHPDNSRSKLLRLRTLQWGPARDHALTAWSLAGTHCSDHPARKKTALQPVPSDEDEVMADVEALPTAMDCGYPAPKLPRRGRQSGSGRIGEHGAKLPPYPSRNGKPNQINFKII